MSNVPSFKELDKEAQERATAYGYNGLFSSRKSVQEAFDYAMKVFESLGPSENVAAITGMMVVINTLALDRTASDQDQQAVLRSMERLCESYMEEISKLRKTLIHRRATNET